MADQKLLLAIDTSTEQTGIALYDGSCLDNVSWSACRDHTILLLDEIDHQLKRRGARAADLAGVAIATGPGRFNALRVGMSVAKGLAFSLELPLIGVPTLDAVAFPWRTGTRPVAGVIDAGRGRLSWQVFDCDPALHRAETRNTSIDEFISSIAALATEVCVTGDVNPTLGAALGTIPMVIFPPVSGRQGRAAAVAEIAYHRLQRGEADDIALLEPLYLHSPRAQRSS